MHPPTHTHMRTIARTRHPLCSPDPYGGGPWGVSINAVSVVNFIAAVGLAVEFIVHITGAFHNGKASSRAAVGVDAGDVHPWWSAEARAQRTERARTALVDVGSSVLTGITLTKLVGVAVLGIAPSALFRLYYFRMYAGIVVIGALHGLAVLPVVLAVFGWAEAPLEEGSQSGEHDDKSPEARLRRLDHLLLEDPVR